MQKIIGFIGYVDKSEFIINLSKILRIKNKKVLVVDGTLEKRMKYTIPTFDVAQAEQVINYDGIDFAVGFTSLKSVYEYICNKTSIADNEDYDYIILDIDNIDSYEYFKEENICKYYFFIEHSTISLIRNEELIRKITEERAPEDKIEMTKVVFKHYVSRASQKYFEARLMEMNVRWVDIEYELTYMDQDEIANLESELSGYIDISRHTKQYISLVTDIASEILDGVTAGDIRKMIKNYSRGRF